MFDNIPKDLSKPGAQRRAKAMTLDGQQIVESQEDSLVGDDGVIQDISSTHYQTAHDGRRLKVDQYVATSWSGIPTPSDRLYTCLNPFGHHEYRAVYLEIDGLTTVLGNVLCTECFEVNKKRQNPWIRIVTLGIYNPEEF
jgi:hypothetical protein